MRSSTRVTRIVFNFNANIIQFWRACYPFLNTVEMTPKRVDAVRSTLGPLDWVEEKFDGRKVFTKR